MGLMKIYHRPKGSTFGRLRPRSTKLDERMVFDASRNMVDGIVTRDKLKGTLIKWNARRAPKAQQKLARGEARSEAECVNPGSESTRSPSPERARCLFIRDDAMINSFS